LFGWWWGGKNTEKKKKEPKTTRKKKAPTPRNQTSGIKKKRAKVWTGSPCTGSKLGDSNGKKGTDLRGGKVELCHREGGGKGNRKVQKSGIKEELVLSKRNGEKGGGLKYKVPSAKRGGKPWTKVRGEKGGISHWSVSNLGKRTLNWNS